MRLTALVFLVSLAACGGGGTEPKAREGDSRCLQTYEFTNLGCAVIAGLVTDSAGRPFSEVYVGVTRAVDSARHVATAGGFAGDLVGGVYRHRVLRMADDSATVDTVSVWVRASVPPPSGTPVDVLGPRDSVVAVLHWQPVGAAPDTIRVPTIVVPTSK